MTRPSNLSFCVLGLTVLDASLVYWLLNVHHYTGSDAAGNGMANGYLQLITIGLAIAVGVVVLAYLSLYYGLASRTSGRVCFGLQVVLTLCLLAGLQ